MANGGSINYSVKFNVDKTGLNQIKSSLQEIRQLTAQDLMKIGGHSDIKRAEGELRELKLSIGEIDRAFNKAFNSDLGTLNVTKFNNSLKDLNLNKIYGDFSKAGAAGQNAFRNITTQVLTTNMQLKQTHNFLNNMATTMANTVKWGVASSVMNNFTGSVQKAYGYVKSLDTSLNNIRIVTEKSSEEMAKFATQANNAAKQLGQTTTNYTDAALIYYQQGLAEEEVRARAETTLKAANVTGQSGEEVSEQLTAVWNGYKVSAEEAELYVDKLAAVAADTAADLEELSTGMSKVASAASLMGVPIDSLNAQMATIVSVTRQAPESVGTALKTIYARMGDIEAGLDSETSLGHYTEEMKAMGVNVLDANGKLRDMGEVIEEVGGKWQGMTREQQIALSQTMAGTRQYNNLLALFDNWDMYTDALNTSANAAGTLQKQQDIYMESTAAHLKQLRAASEDLYDSLLDPKGLNPVIDGLTLITNLFSNFVDSIGGGGGVLLALGSIGTKVFSQQIAKGLATTIINLRATKDNASQVAAQMALLEQFKGLNIADGMLQNLVKMKQEVIQLGDVLSVEQQNEANSIIKTTNELQNQKTEWQENLRIASEYIAKQTNLGQVDFSAGFGDRTDDLEKIRGTLDGLEQQFTKTGASIDIYEKNLNELKSATAAYNNETSKSNGDRQLKALDALNNSLLIAEINMNELIESEQTSAKAKEILIKGIENYNKALQQGESLEKAGDILIQSYKKANLVMQEEVKKTRQIVEKEANGASQKIQENIGHVQSKWESFLSTARLTNQIKQSLDLVSAFGQVASALNTLINIKNVWDDDTLTEGEKFLQTLTAIGFAGPMLATNLKTVGNVLNLNTAFTKALKVVTQEYNAEVLKGSAAASGDVASKAAMTTATEVYTGSVSKATVAMKTFWKAIPLVGQVAIIVGLVGAAVAIFDKFTVSAKEASESLDKSLTSYKEAEESLQNLEKELETTTTRLQELKDLAANGNISLVEQEELEKLEAQNRTLEAQIKLEEQKLALKEKEAAENAKEAVNSGSFKNSFKNPLSHGQLAYGNDKTGILKLEDYGIGAGQNISIFDTAGFEEWKQGMLEAQTEAQKFANQQGKYADEYQQVADEIEKTIRIADEEWAKARADAVVEMGEKYVQGLESLPALESQNTEGQYDDVIQQIKESNQQYLELSGQLTSITMDSFREATDGNYERQLELFDILQKNHYENWNAENLQSVGFNIEEIVALQEEADKAGISLDSLIDRFNTLGSTELPSFENNIEKIHSLSKESGVGGTVLYEPEIRDTMTSLGEEYGVDDSFLNRAIENIDFSKIDYSNFKEGFEAALREAIENQDIEDQINEREQFNKDTADKGKLYAEEYDIDAEQFENLSKLIRDTADEMEGFSDKILENGEAAQECAKEILRYDKAVESVKENSEDWMKILKGDNLQDQADIIDDLADAYGNMFDIDGSHLSADFLTNAENLALMQQAANGSEEAYNQLQQTMGEDILAQVGLDTSKYQADLNEINSMAATAEGMGLADVEAGASLDNTDFLNALTQMVNASGMTAEAATDYLSSMGVDAEVINVPQTVEETVATDLVANMGLARMNYHVPASDGTPTSQEATYPEVTYTTRPVVQTKTIAGTGLKVTSAHKSTGGGVKFKNSSHGGGSKGSSGGKGGGGGGGGGGGSSKPKTEKKAESKKDRYHDVNVRLEQIDDQLEDIGKDQEKLFGKDLIDSLNEELDILEKQRDTLKEKLDIARQEQAELQHTLRQSGVQFNEDGTIANYLSIIEQKEAEYNALVDQYNSLAAGDAQDNFKETVLDPAKENLDKLYENIEAYDDLILDTIPEIENGIDDISDREVEIKVQKLNMEMELRLDLSEAQKDWNEFKREVIDDVDDDDVLGNALADKDLFENLISNGSLEAGTRELQSIMDEINEMNETGSSDIFGENKQKSLEELKASMEDLMGVMKDLDELQEQMAEHYLESIDNVIDAYEEQADSYEYVNDLIEHNLNLIELIHGDDAYAEMAKTYEQMEKNNLDIVASYKAAADYYKQMMEQETDPEAREKWEEAWKDSIANLNDAVETSVENIVDKYKNTINVIFDELNDKVTNGKGLDYVNLEWELNNENQDAYLDAINSEYELQQLERKYRDSIDSADSISAQRSLNKLMDEELKKLREKDKLTQYDIDRANAKYELRLKEIALEEAQQNKTQMRLRRDSSGNYSYQFVADQDSISAAQQEVDEARNSLYNMDKDAYRENQQAILDTWNEFQEKMRDSANMSAEERALIEQQYNERINNLLGENNVIRVNLNESAFMEMEAMYDNDEIAFQEMTAAEQEILMNQMVPNWNNSVQEMVDTFVGEGGFLPTCEQAFLDLDQATIDYNTSLEILETTAGVSFGAISEGYNTNIELAKDLAAQQQEIINKTIEEKDATEELKGIVDDLANSYKAVGENAKNALIEAQKLLEWEQKKAAEEAAAEEQRRKEQEQQQNPGGGSGGNPGGGGAGSGNGTALTSDIIDGVAGAIYYWTPAAWGTGNDRKQKIESKFGAGSYSQIQGYINQHVDLAGNLKQQFKYGWGDRDKYKNYYYSKFDTGGYTGDWIGEDGKLAMLHQKELVLNADDTQHILTAVSMVRDMNSMFTALNDSILSRVTGMTQSLTPQAQFEATQGELNQNVNIQASFPGVSSRAEIEQAFANLVSMASQHAYNTQR